MQNILKISQQTLWQILGKVVTSLSTFIILGLVARNYREEGTGVFTLALTYLAIFYLLSDFGFNAHVLARIQGISKAFLSDFVRNVGYRVQKEWNKLLGTRIVWSGLLVVLAVGSLPFWPFATAEFSRAVLFGSLAIVASGIFVTCNLIFQSKLRYDLSVMASSLGTLGSLAVFVYFISFKYPIPLLLLAHLLGWVIIALVAIILVKRIFQSISPIFSKSYTVNLFQSSWPIAATLGLNVVYFRADSFMVAYFKNVSDAGIYNIAYSVFQSALVLPTFIMNAYYPMMLRSLKGVKFVALGLLVVASLGTLLTISLAPLLTQLLTGGGFLGATVSLQILSLGFPAYFLSALLMWVMVVKGRYKVMMVIYGLGLSVNLILNFIYIPQYSFIAASWTTVISEYIILILQLVVLKRVFKI